MPRRISSRDLTQERVVAGRVNYEREQRGWSLERLAAAMTDAGCTMPASALHKIEKGDPPRAITLTEFLTFAQVFGLSLSELLTDASRARQRAQAEQLRRLEKAERACTAPIERFVEAHAGYLRLIESARGSNGGGDRQFRTPAFTMTARDGRRLRVEMTVISDD
jgi:transcriptional regulator with XRE-family HTH domain